MDRVYGNRSWLVRTLGALLLLALLVVPAGLWAQEELQTTHIGQQMDGRIRSGQSESWVFRGCADDRLSIEVSSGTLTPQFTLHTVDSQDSLLDSEVDGRVASGEVTLPKTGMYVVTVKGRTSITRGNYQLSIALADEDAAPAEQWINLNEVGNVSMTSKYSKLMLDDGGDLTADSATTNSI